MNTKKLPTRSDEANAFIPEPGPSHTVSDDLAEYLGESFVNSATGGEAPNEDDDRNLNAQAEVAADADDPALEDEDEAVVEIELGAAMPEGIPKQTAKRAGQIPRARPRH